MVDSSKGLARSRELPRYLALLSSLLGRSVTERELLTSEETYALRERSLAVERGAPHVFEVPIGERRGRQFSRLIARLVGARSCAVYFWASGTEACGLLPPFQLSSVEFNFAYDLDPNGVFVFVSCDFQDRLLLDFSGDGSGGVLEIEVSGPHWGCVSV